MKKIFQSMIGIISMSYCCSMASISASAICNANVDNFNYELSQNFASSLQPNLHWGPRPNILALSPANPNLNICMQQAGTEWQQRRIVAAADYWIKQKLNYCHHYLPNYITPLANRGANSQQGGYCNPAVDIMPGSVFYHQQARWNYNGTGSETLANWTNNRMWYGMDCSNYTAFLYNFAFGIKFNSNVVYQSGQRSDGSQNNLSPNQQNGANVLDNPGAPGKLVCADNTVEVAHSCDGHGGYFSVIDSTGNKNRNTVTPEMLAKLHPGDLLFIAARKNKTPFASEVTHVAMWIGKKVGNGANDIPASKIAPNKTCPQNEWQPKVGEWVITDSHYQGADYRVFTSCFYLNNLWGVRRIIQ